MTIKVDQALISGFIAGAFGLPIAHENLPYTPVAGTAYAEIIVFDAGTAALSLNDSDEQIGIFQVILRYPLDAGAVPIKTTAEALFTYFKIASRHTYSGQSVEILGHDRGAGRAVDGWFQIVCRMRFRAFVDR